MLLSFCSSYSQEAEVKIPHLNGHYFTTVSKLRSPFIQTSFKTYTGYGETENLDFRLINTGGRDIFGLQGDVSFVDVNLAYEQKVREWMAVYMSYGYVARIGTDVQSLLFQGVNTISGLELGWKIRLLHNKKHIVSCNFNLQQYQGSFMNIIGFITDVIDSVPNPSLKQNIPLLRGQFGANYAWGINDLFGFRAEGDINWGETYKRGKDAFGSSFMLIGDLNLYQRYNFPLGITFAYQISSDPDIVTVEDSFAQFIHWNLSYTGSPDFLLGGEFAYAIIPLPNLESRPNVFFYSFNVKYYF